LEGNGYNINSGIITLTTAAESALLYVKSTDSKIFIVKEIIVSLSNSTGGSGTGTLRVYRNPTTGTIISGASPANVNNRAFYSQTSFGGQAFKGATGNTITSPTTPFLSTTRSTFTEPIPLDAEILALGQGNSIGVSWQPPAGNTSQTAIVLLIGAFKVADIV
jgi:hypothetical protein